MFLKSGKNPWRKVSGLSQDLKVTQTYSRVVMWVNLKKTELTVEIYSKRRVTAFDKVLLLEFS